MHIKAMRVVPGHCSSLRLPSEFFMNAQAGTEILGVGSATVASHVHKALGQPGPGNSLLAGSGYSTSTGKPQHSYSYTFCSHHSMRTDPKTTTILLYQNECILAAAFMTIIGIVGLLKSLANSRFRMLTSQERPQVLVAGCAVRLELFMCSF